MGVLLKLSPQNLLVFHWTNYVSLVTTLIDLEVLSGSYTVDYLGNMEDTGVPSVTKQDVAGIYEGLTRLQSVYSLRLETMQKGIIAGAAADPLWTEDLFILGLAAKKVGLKKTALDWLALAKTKAEKDGGSKGEDILELSKGEEVNIYAEVRSCGC